MSLRDPPPSLTNIAESRLFYKTLENYESQMLTKMIKTRKEISSRISASKDYQKSYVNVKTTRFKGLNPADIVFLKVPQLGWVLNLQWFVLKDPIVLSGS
jgi:hypothetical protein